MTTLSRVKAIAAHCRNCSYDDHARGTWREQTAACVSSNCALHPFRPVPRDCIVAGSICLAQIAKIRAKLEA